MFSTEKPNSGQKIGHLCRVLVSLEGLQKRTSKGKSWQRSKAATSRSERLGSKRSPALNPSSARGALRALPLDPCRRLS
eukprot:1398938-Alexandrium_andersonii.AAC.1